MGRDGPNGSNGPSRRGLSEEDRLLWAEVVRRATPLHGQRRLRGSTALPEPPGPAPEPSGESPAPGPAKTPPPPRRTPDRPRGEAVPVGRPQPGMDRRTAERLRRGERAPDARIDLHGMTAAAAHAALDAFVGSAVARGARFLLVITGKGGRGGGRGLLRDAVPGWLRAGPHGTRILGIFEAHRKHGGAGALYVYLRKR